jgi:hypothetical protein
VTTDRLNPAATLAIVDIRQPDQGFQLQTESKRAGLLEPGLDQIVELPDGCKLDAAEIDAGQADGNLGPSPEADKWAASVSRALAGFSPACELRRDVEWPQHERQSLDERGTYPDLPASYE